MVAPKFKVVGRGVYSISEASHLTGVPTRRLRRWVGGYRWKTRKGEKRWSDPVVHSDLPEESPGTPVSFADLMEIRFLDAFRQYGASWEAIRIAARRAADILETTHPFSSRRFKTDGKTILAEIVNELGETELLDLVLDQWEFERVVSPFLLGVEYAAEGWPARWWWQGDMESGIIIDPALNFGAPTVASVGLPTSVLAAGVPDHQSVADVAFKFEIPEEAVQKALEFERQFLAS